MRESSTVPRTMRAACVRSGETVVRIEAIDVPQVENEDLLTLPH